MGLLFFCFDHIYGFGISKVEKFAGFLLG